MKLLGNNKSKMTKGKNDENIPNLEITEVVLVHCSINNNNYQQESIVKSQFVNLFLINCLVTYKIFLLKNFIFKNIYFRILYTEIWFIDQNSKPLETEDKLNITLVVN